jgi:hypothetical protein
VIDKATLLSWLSQFPGVVGEPEIEGEGPTRARVETRSTDDAATVYAALQLAGWEGDQRGAMVFIDLD